MEEALLRFFVVWLIATFIASILTQLDLVWWGHMLGGAISITLCLAAFYWHPRRQP